MNLITNSQSRMFVWSLHLAGVAVVALTLGGFYVLVHQPLERKQANAINRAEQLDLLLLKTGTERNDYRRLRDQLAIMKESVAELHGQLSAQQQEMAFVADLNRLAEELDLQVLDYQIGLTNSFPTHSQTEVEFRYRGSYASICHFLQQTEQLTKVTKLSNFELQASENSRGYPIQLTFVLYSGGKSHDTKEKRGVL